MSQTGARRSVGWGAILSPAAVALASLVAVAPILVGPLPATHDGLHHLFRLFELDRSLRAWHLYPRIFADMGFGYGYPVLNYYSPLSYYLAWLGTASGLGYIGGLKFAYTIGALAAALGMYAWTRTFLPAWGAFLAAMAYTYFPYRIADMAVRGALAEATAFVWPPLLLWGLARFRQSRNPAYVAWLALLVAGFVLTHNLTAFMFAPLLGLYVALLYGLPWAKDARRLYLCLAAGISLGILLAGFYWLPSALEVRFVLAGTVSGLTDLLSLLAPLGQWLSPYPLQRYIPFQGVAGQHPVGIVQAMAALFGLAGLIVGWRGSSQVLPAAGATALVATTASFVLLTPASASLWRYLPGLRYLQFPWRLQAVIGLCTAIFTGCLGLLPLPRPWGWLAAVALSAALAASSLLGLKLEPAQLPSAHEPLSEEQVSLDGLLDYDFQTALWLREYGGEWLLEYLPIWALGERDHFFLPAEPAETATTLSADSYIEVLEDRPLSTNLRVTLSQPATIVLHRFYFPGWVARLDGQPLASKPVGRLGLLAVNVPRGEHRLQVSLGNTPPRLVGLAMSAVAVAILASWSLRKRLYVPLLTLLCATMFFLALVTLRVSLYPTVRHPQTLSAQLGDTARLLAYTAEKRGNSLDVWLYWLALQPSDQNYKVFVHATGPDGLTLAQHDGQPGNEFTPTSRWLPGELIVDRHTLPLPSGPISLYVGMYKWPEVVNLPVIQDGVLSPDGRVFLGSVDRP